MNPRSFDALRDLVSSMGQGRRAPSERVPSHEGSVLRELSGRAYFPNTEWWWNCVHARLAGPGERSRTISLISNVQLFAEPLGAESPVAAMVAVRDVLTGEKWLATASGVLSRGRDCRFRAPGWSLFRLDPSGVSFDEDAREAGLEPHEARRAFPHGCYVIRIAAPTVETDLIVRQGPCARFGSEGWVDNNPDGAFPMWASLKIRAGIPLGAVRLRERDGWARFEVTEGHAQFDHQSVHGTALESARGMNLLDVSRTLPALFQAATARFRWNWWRATLADGAHLLAYRIVNRTSGKVQRVFAALSDADGTVMPLDPRSISFDEEARVGRLAVPNPSILSFAVPPGGFAAPGSHRVVFEHDEGFDWVVPYGGPAGLVCQAHEAACRVTDSVDDGTPIDCPVGLQETIDMVTSLEREVRSTVANSG